MSLRGNLLGQCTDGAAAPESQMCVAATAGVPDIVEHRCTGYLAKPLDTEDLARGIKWILEEGSRTAIKARAREKAVRCFSSAVVSAKYINLYKVVLANSR